MATRRFLLLYALALSGALALSARTAPPEPAGFKLNGDAKRGREVYLKRCALCHGEKGDGRGKVGAASEPRPTDFTAPGLLAERSDWEIYAVVRDGGPAIGLSTKMFGWKKLIPDQEVRDVSAYVRSLAP